MFRFLINIPKGEINDILQRADIVKFTKSLRLRQYAHVERVQNQLVPKQIATVTATVEVTRKKRPRKRWTDSV